MEVVVDVRNIKAEKDHTMENAARENSQAEEYCVYIKKEEKESPECVYCNICWTYCESRDTLKEHLEANLGCKQYKKSGLTCDIDVPKHSSNDESCSLQEFINENRYHADLMPGYSHVDSNSRNKSVIDPFKKTSSDFDNITVKHFICDLCTKSFTRKSNLIRHKLIHSGVNPFPCDECNQSFNEKSNLIKHKLIHSGIRPFSCDVCYQSFNQKSNLVKHKLIHSGIKAFNCDICNQSFSLKSILVKHKLIHAGLKPFICEICNHSFTQKSNLVRHKLTHSGVKPFSCDVCTKSFALKNHLVQHYFIHTGIKPFTCNICNKSYTQKNTLVIHKRIHTSV